MLRKTSTSSSMRRTDPAMGALGQGWLSRDPQKLVSPAPSATSPGPRHQDPDRMRDDSGGEGGLSPGLTVELDGVHRMALDPDLPAAGVAHIGVESLDVRRHAKQVPDRPD